MANSKFSKMSPLEKQQKADAIRQQVSQELDTLDLLQKSIQTHLRELSKLGSEMAAPSEMALNAARKMGPMDDLFFNKISEDPEAIEEIISTILGIDIAVQEVVPQYTITGIGHRGVRLDSFSRVVPHRVIRTELMENCYLGEKGSFVNIEVQRVDNDDFEYRVYYNGASIVVNNTPRGTKRFADIARAVVIFISEFDVFGEGEMFYEIQKVISKSGTPTRSPVTEIYINVDNLEKADRNDDRMRQIADLMKVFRDPDLYDYENFPKFSQRKEELKNTQEGVYQMGAEFQEIIDAAENAGVEKGEKIGVGKGENKLGSLITELIGSGRNNEIARAASDPVYREKLYKEFKMA